eukprot:350159-Chlamydomonas_euryale.AAC.4
MEIRCMVVEESAWRSDAWLLKGVERTRQCTISAEGGKAQRAQKEARRKRRRQQNACGSGAGNRRQCCCQLGRQAVWLISTDLIQD